MLRPKAARHGSGRCGVRGRAEKANSGSSYAVNASGAPNVRLAWAVVKATGIGSLRCGSVAQAVGANVFGVKVVSVKVASCVLF